MPCGLLLSMALTFVACPLTDRVTVNEVFYDALGDDTGSEFVELFNPTSGPVELSGLRLESGDGAAAGRWTLRWTAPVGLLLGSGARFVIGGARVTPAPDTVVELALQNGPDAIRLTWPDGVAEVVGYGPLDEPDYFCGHPAVDVASGQSLARIPDHAMSGDNALDFRANPPSPGNANQLHRHVAWLAGGLTLAPPQPEPTAPVRVAGQVINAGSDSIPARALTLRLSLVRPTGVEPRADLVVPQAMAPGETLAVALDARAPESGVHVWQLALDLEGDESPLGTIDSLRARTGPGMLELTEIQFHPARGEGEWIEARNRSSQAVDLGGWTLRDRSGTRGRARTEAALAPDSFVVFVQYREAWMASYPRLDTTRVVALAPWPSLNNSDDGGGIADAIELDDASGLPADHGAYSAAGVPAGVPLERGSDGHWRAALDPLGTPLAPPRKPAPIAGVFALLAPRLPAGVTTTRVAWALPWREARIRIDVYDLAGDHIAALLGDTPVAGRGERDVAIATLGAGCYVVAFEGRPQAGPGTATATRTLRIEGAGP